MNSDIRYLEWLDHDLQAAAERESSGQGGGRRSGGGRRRGGGGRRWLSVAAGVVALLVVAGLVGTVVPRLSERQVAGTAALDAGEMAPSDGDAAPWLEQEGKALRLNVRGNQSVEELPYMEEGALGEANFAGLDDSDTGGARYSAFTIAQANTDGGGGAGDGGGDASTQLGPQGDLSKIVRTGSITVIVANGGFPDTLSEVTDLAGSLDGFVLSSSTNEETSGSITIRIPAARFDAAMQRLRNLGEVDAESIQADDVTNEYMDTTSRLRILRNRRNLLTDIQNKATNTTEILRLGSQIDQIQLEIEGLQGNLKYLQDQVAISTIDGSLREQDAPEEPGPDDPGVSLVGAWRTAVRGMTQVLAAIMIGLGYLIPLLILAGIAWLIVSRVRRRRS